MDLDHLEATVVVDDILRIETLLGCGIFNFERVNHPLRESAFIELMIRLQDITAKSKKVGHPIQWTDDVTVYPDDNLNNVEQLISIIRACACHISSPNHNIQENRHTQNTFYGIGASLVMGIEIKSIYPDDVCFAFGKYTIYI